MPPKRRGDETSGAEAKKRKSWTPAEESQLRTLVAELGPGAWPAIAQRLGTGRSATAVDQHWRKSAASAPSFNFAAMWSVSESSGASGSTATRSFRRPPAHYPPGTDNNQPINPDLEGTLLATPPQRAADATNPMTLIELGMSLERQRSAERSPARGTTPPQNDGVQQALALINEVRGLAESLSPRQSRSPPAPRGPLATASSSRAIINPAQQPGRVSPREEPRLSFEGDEDSRI